MLRRNKILLTLGAIAVVLIAVRMALPYAVKDYVNRTLQSMTTYTGSVADVDLSLWRGAYRIDGLRIDKRDKQNATPFFSSDRVDLSVEWRSLMRGSLVSEVVFDRANIVLVQAKSAQDSQTGKEEDWQDQIEKLFPFRFNTVEVRDSVVTFQAPGIKSKDALRAEAVNGTLSNLTNVADVDEETFADFALTARMLDTGSARIDGSINPWAKQPTFDINVEVKQVSLPKVNPWLRQYIKADAESGDFELFLEIAAAEGKFKGYAKPILKNVNITSSEEDDNVLRKLWEGVVEFAADLFENKQKDQVAARIPFSGSVEDPKAGIMETIVSVVRNAFVSAFARSLEGSISLRDVKKNLSEYSADDDKKEKRG